MTDTIQPTNLTDKITALTVQLTEIRHALDLHIAANEETQRKVELMYEKLVIGNGQPSLVDRVRRLEDAERRLTWVTGAVGLILITEIAQRLLSLAMTAG